MRAGAPLLARESLARRVNVASERASIGVVNARAQKLLEEILELPVEDQAFIAHGVEANLESKLTQEEIDQAWTKELERRVRDVREGKSKGRDAREVMAELREELRASRR